MAGGYALAVRFTLRNAQAAERFDELVSGTIGGIRSEPGTLIYTVHTPSDEPLVRFFYELYADQDAFQAHEQQEHTKRFLSAREELLSDVHVTFLHATAELSKGPKAEGP
ncbi:putative quinol monooxygenase [Streptomyces sp. NPDC127172]|uniref:putative quinol monooxygenase n=1 Tax=Streptomyces sp. NPDC127172 TaxID=3345382 RepID=UPI00362B37B3